MNALLNNIQTHADDCRCRGCKLMDRRWIEIVREEIARAQK